MPEQFLNILPHFFIRKRYLFAGMIILCIVSLAGCKKKATSTEPNTTSGANTEQSVPLTEFIGIITDNPMVSDNATDSAVLSTDSSIQSSEHAFFVVTDPMSQTEKSFEVGPYVTVYDNYNTTMSLSNLMPGTPVLVKYDSSNLKPDSITISNAYWELKNTANLSINHDTQTIAFGTEVYHFDNNVLIFRDNRLLDSDDLHPCDRVRMYGDKQRIYSIVVDSGHGYLRLINASYYVGGSISSTKFGAKITKNMTLTVPEGSHTLQINKNFVSIEKKIYIEQDQTLVIDMAPYKSRIPKKGFVRFQVNPADAALYIADKLYSHKEPIELEYGEYRVVASKGGYASQSGTLVVDSSYKTISIQLEKEEVEEDDSSSSGSTGAAKSTIMTTSGADVYLDGQRIGTSPATFTNTEGQHTVTLSKSGYYTQTYTFTISNIAEPLTLQYGELTPLPD